ncbi:MAG: hypothetical protein WD825_02330 [Gemmatimonadaceae bacterium]
MRDTHPANGADAFDFLIGDWSVLHRRLQRRLVGDNNWIEFQGPATARKILGGLGNIDEYRIDLPAGSYLGSSVRLFEGKPIRVRFEWSGMTRAACRWEQAFSVDAGASWEPNWTMAFTRV